MTLKSNGKTQDQRMLSLTPEVKAEFDKKLNRLNELRTEARMGKLRQTDLVSIMLKKVQDKDFKSTDF